MLVLTRRVGESIRVGNDIVVTLVQVSPGKVRIGIQAPDDTVILRDELIDKNGPTPMLIASPEATASAPLARRG